MKRILVVISILSFPLLTCNSKSDMTVNTTPVRNFDLEQYLGTWYEIARFPHSFEKDLIGVKAHYSRRDDGKIAVVNSGYKNSFDGQFKSITGKAKTTADLNTGYLKVSFFLFFYADYKILELDTLHYKYALVGSSSDKYLWILSRTPILPEETYEMLVEKAKSRGYNTANLIRVKQKPLPKFKKGETI